MSKVYRLQRLQQIHTTLDKAWDFFSDPQNLQAITPGYMGFKILPGAGPGKMYAGQLIEYRVKPLPFMNMYWMTEITHVHDKVFFVDEQRFGPYRFWHHQHHFKQVSGIVEMTDIVHYKIPYWFFGDLANALFVQKRLEEIFNFRKQKIEQLFPK